MLRISQRTCANGLFDSVRPMIVGSLAFGALALWAPWAIGQDEPGTPQWNEAEVVFIGQVTEVKAGPVGMSFPPVHTHTLRIKVSDVLRGDLKAGEKVTCSHSARQELPPEFSLEKPSIVAAMQVRGGLVIRRIEIADETNTAEAKAGCNLPLGWRVDRGQPISPWAELGKQAWNGDAGDAKTVCSKSGRPALFAGPEVLFEVEHVPPVREVQWSNPDGDGEYKVTVSNPTKNPLVVPALLTDGKEILWANSLVILCQGRAYPCPDFKLDAGPLKPVTLKPGESVSGVVNALKLQGPEWPRGGYRIVFQFCLGEKGVSKSFYYMARHHDPIRDRLLSKQKK